MMRFVLPKHTAAILLFCVVALSVLVVLPEGDAADVTEPLFIYYGRLGLNSFAYFGSFLVVSVIVFLIARLGIISMTLIKKPETLSYILEASSITHKCREVLASVKGIVITFAPILVGVSILTLTLSGMNAANVPHLQDALLAEAGRSIFGTYPFIAVTNLEYPDLLLIITLYFFGGIYPLIVILFFALFVFHKKIFADFVTSFFISFILMVFLWNVFPALSPHDRYIDNVYGLEVHKEMRTALNYYSPHPLVTDFLQDIRTWKNNTLVHMPTSTFPSAHVVWAFFIVFYPWKVRRVYGLLGIPVLLFVGFGAVIFGQHYIVDVPAGILIACVSVWLTSSLPDVFK